MQSIIKGFMLTLEDCDTQSITYAFKQWMKQSSAMPTPADIYNIAIENMKYRRESGSSQRIQAAPRTENMNRVAWCGMSWKEIQNSPAMMEALEKHLVELTEIKGKEAANDYMLYIKNGPRNEL